jgi:hypothetical protein
LTRPLLRHRVFRAGDSHESQRGSRRLLATLTHELAETLAAWRQLVAPVAEQVASLLLEREPTVEKLSTPLTLANRRADRPAGTAARPPTSSNRACHGRSLGANAAAADRLRGTGPTLTIACCTTSATATTPSSAPAATRSPAGAMLASIRRTGASPPRRDDGPPQREQREWDAAHVGTIADAGLFVREILPTIQALPLSDLVRATGLTHGYLSKVRRGEKVPHPRHWPALMAAGSRVP